MVAALGQFAALDSFDLGYSLIQVAITSLAAISLGVAVLIVVLEWNIPVLMRIWKPIFWLSCFDLVVGTVMDWGHISGSFGFHFFIVELVAIFLAPAYYFSYALAYKSRPGTSAHGT